MILPSTDHDAAVFGALALTSTILGGILGDHASAAVLALVVSVVGQFLARALRPSADVLGVRIVARITGRHPAQPPAAPDPSRDSDPPAR